jgi:EmrB/QacA subfamily drug resistance transporter
VSTATSSPLAARAGREPLDPLNPRVWRISAVALLGPLLTSLDSTVVNVSLATLGRELHVGLATLQWVVTGYLLALALMLPLSGWLVDRVGAKRVYLGCFALFTVASALCGAAPTAAWLIAARVLQGMAGGLLAPMAQMMVAREAPQHIARVMGTMVIPVLLGPILGPTLAGLILQHGSWRWIFLLNLPIGVLAVVLAVWILPKDAGSARRRSFDGVGFLLLSPGLALLLYSLEGLSAGATERMRHLLELAAALGLLAGFGVHAARRGSRALIDLRLFKNGPFRASAMTQFLSTGASFAGQMLLPLYLLSMLHLTPARTGLLLAPTGLGMLCSFPMMGRMVERFGVRWVSATGSLLALVGTLLFALWSGTGLAMWAIAGALFVRGVGMGSIGLPSLSAAYASIPKEAIPVATTASNIVQRLGGPVATTTLAIFLHARTAAVGSERAFAAGLWLLCGFQGLVLLAALRLPLRVERRQL